MRHSASPIFDKNKQALFCIFAMFWVSNIAPFLMGQTLLLRVLVYPLYGFLIIILSVSLFDLKKIKLLPKFSSVFIVILISFCLLSIIRGFIKPLSINDFRSLLFDRAGSVVVWLMPAALFWGISVRFWISFINIVPLFIKINLIYIVFLIAFSLLHASFLVHKVYNSSDFLFIAPLLIVFAIYKKNKKVIVLSILAILLLVIHMFLMDERFAIAFEGLICIFFLFLIFRIKRRLNIKLFFIVTGFLLVVFILFGISSFPYFQQQVHRYFVEDELFKDTRGHGSLAEAVEKGMTFKEKVFGKGINGTYVFGMIGWPPKPYIRSNVEIGYKQIILKGGYSMLFIFLAISLQAIFLGILRTNNVLTKCLALMILARLCIMVTAMIPRVGFEYLFFWLAIGACLSKEVRAMGTEFLLQKIWTKRIIY